MNLFLTDINSLKSEEIIEYEEEMSLTFIQAIEFLFKRHLFYRIFVTDPFDIIFIAKCFMIRDFINGLFGLIKKGSKDDY